MKRLAMPVFVCACTLVPTTARADDGGWIDWLFGMDVKLVGVGTEVHVVCVQLDPTDNTLKLQPCEQWFKNIGRILAGLPPENKVKFDNIRHQLDFRVAAYWKYGSRFSDVIDERSLHAYKLMGMYQFHVSRKVQVGAGGGALVFQGDGFEHFSRGIVTPISVVYSPADDSALTLRVEESYITHGMSAVDFGNTTSTYAKTGEWNFSFAVGYDLRRLR